MPSGHDELYVVIARIAIFTVEDDEVEAPFGTIVFVRDPAVSPGAVAREPPGFAEDVRTDSDLEPLRSDPRFHEIVGAAP